MSSELASVRSGTVWVTHWSAVAKPQQKGAQLPWEPHASLRPLDLNGGPSIHSSKLGRGGSSDQFSVGIHRALGGRARSPWIGAIAGAAVELAGAAVLGLARAERGVRDGESEVEGGRGGGVHPYSTTFPPRPAALIPDPLGVAARGAAHGLIYGGLISSARLPTWSKGLGYGVARFLASEGGGIANLLGPISPHRAVPLLDTIVADEDRDEGLISHLVAGVALAMIYESSPESSGTTRGSEDPDED